MDGGELSPAPAALKALALIWSWGRRPGVAARDSRAPGRWRVFLPRRAAPGLCRKVSRGNGLCGAPLRNPGGRPLNPHLTIQAQSQPLKYLKLFCVAVLLLAMHTLCP